MRVLVISNSKLVEKGNDDESFTGLCFRNDFHGSGFSYFSLPTFIFDTDWLQTLPKIGVVRELWMCALIVFPSF